MVPGLPRTFAPTSAPSTASTRVTAVVDTASGRVTVLSDRNTARFLGILFAA
ncbi:MAG: hypothetical protein H7146_04325, partial [Burkholderiaceae bacterium]|nr:hypothetical protein [Microbacteriaceae bacterium]